MSETPHPRSRVVSELIEYWVVVFYLSCVFGLFTWYRRLILAEYQISYVNWGVAVIEALVLAKVILVGDVLRLGRGLERRPLAITTLYRSVLFSMWVAAFSVVEHAIIGAFKGRGFAGGVSDLLSKGKYELIAESLVVFFAFIPFFAFKELERVFGAETLRRLLFRGRPESPSEPSYRAGEVPR